MTMGRPVVDLTGQRFGRLTVLRQAEEQKKGTSRRWVCRCDCGNEIVVAATNLKSGCTSSCGCKKRELMAGNIRERAAQFYTEGTFIPNLTCRVRRDRHSGVKGVYWNASRQKWEAYITLNGKRRHIGRFTEKEEAVKARRAAEEELFGPVLDEFNKSVCK